MKLFVGKISVITLIAALSVGFISPNPVKTTYVADPSASTIEWRGEKVTGFHTGTIQLKEGAFDFEEGVLLGGSFVIDMTTIANTDIQKEGMRAKLVGHLSSDDFFGVEKHPTASFVIKDVGAKGDGKYYVTGDITIKGATEQISFDVTTSMNGKQVTAEASITIDRSKFDVRYGSNSFFDNLGNKAIYNDFVLTTKIVGKSDS